MSDFYKMDPAAWDFGTSELSLEEEAAYLRIVNAIHKHKSGVPDNDRVLAGMFRCSTRKARSLISALAKAGKVTVEDGIITNDRAVSDLVRRGFVSNSRAESGAKGGRVRAERAAKSLENKDTGQAIPSSREEKRREESIPDGMDAASAVDPPGDDFAKQVFDRAVAFLGRHGTPERQARAMVGRWRKDSTDAQIFEAFTECSRAGAVDPIPWITARLTPSQPMRVRARPPSEYRQ